MSQLSWIIPPEIRPLLTLGLAAVPAVVPIGGRLMRLRDTLTAAVADGDLDLEDALQIGASYATAPLAPARPLPANIEPLPADDDDDFTERDAQVWPDAIDLTLNWAHEPGLDAEGQRALVPAAVHEVDGVIVFDAHPSNINDSTKVTMEAKLRLGDRGLHFSEYPHLAGAIQWVALVNGREVGSIGGGGNMNTIPRTEAGVGWGGKRYLESSGTLGVANVMSKLKGAIVTFEARVPLSPFKPTSRTLTTRVVV